MSVAAPNTYASTYLPPKLKRRAEKALKSQGLSAGQILHDALVTLVESERVKTPSDRLEASIEELTSGGGAVFSSVEALMADLNADD
jgi:hypothetical protein